MSIKTTLQPKVQFEKKKKKNVKYRLTGKRKEKKKKNKTKVQFNEVAAQRLSSSPKKIANATQDKTFVSFLPCTKDYCLLCHEKNLPGAVPSVLVGSYLTKFSLYRLFL